MPRRSRRTARRITAARALIALLASTGLLGVLAPSAVADACTAGTTKTWTGAGGDGQWSTAANWAPSGVPGASAVVCIPAGTPAITITTAATAGYLAAATPIDLAGGSLQLSNANNESTTTSTFTMSGGNLIGAGDLRVLSGGAFNWTSIGSMNGPSVGISKTIVDPGATMAVSGASGSTRTIERRELVVNGAGTFAEGAPLYGYASAKVDVGSGGTLTFTGNGAELVDAIGSGATRPALRVLGGGRLIHNGPTAAATLISMPVVNQGTIEAATGTMAFSGGTAASSVNNGAWNATGGVNKLTAGTFTLSGASLTGSGTALNVEGGTVDLATGTITTVAPTATMIVGNGGTLKGPGTASVSGILNWDAGGAQDGTGLTEVQSGGQLNLIQSQLANAPTRALTQRTVRMAAGSSGVYSGTADTYFYDAGKLEVGGTLDVRTDDGAFTDAIGSGQRALRVLAGGTLKRTNGAQYAISSGNSVPLENDGTVDAAEGDFAFAGGGSGVSSGVFKAASGRFTELTSGTLNADTAKLEGAGALRLVGGTLNLSTAGAAFTSAAESTLWVGNGGTLSGPGTASLAGTLAWDAGGAQSGTGLTEVLSGGQLNLVQSMLDNAPTRGLTGRTVRMAGGSTGAYTGTADTYFYDAGKLEVGGTLDVRSDDGAFTDAVGSGSRALRVLAGGTLKRTNGAQYPISGGNSAPLENDGTVDAAEGDFAFSGGGAGVSTGEWKAAANRSTTLAGGTWDAGTSSVTGAGALRLVGGTLNLSTAAAVLTGAAESTLWVGDGGTLGGPGTANVLGTLAWDSGGAQSGAGLTEVKSGGTLKLLQSNANHAPVRSLTGRTVRMAAGSSGVYDGTTDTYFYEAGKLEIGGTLDVRTNSQAFVDAIGSGTRAVRVLPGGTLKRTNGAQYAISADNNVPLENDGTVEAAEGDWEFNAGSAGASSGIWKSGAGRFIRLNGASHDVDGGSVEGAGQLRFINATLNVLTAKTLTVAAGGTLEEDSGANITGPGTLAVAGVLDWAQGSTMSGTGTTKILDGGSLVTSKPRLGSGLWRALDQRVVRVEEGGTATLGRPISAGYAAGEAGWIGQSNGGRFDVAGRLVMAGPHNPPSGGGASPNVFDNGSAGGFKILATGTLARHSAGTVYVTVPVENAGIVSVDTGRLDLQQATTGWTAGTSTLDGGTFNVSGTGHLVLQNVNAQKLGAKVILDGANSKLTGDGTTSALAALDAITSTGGLTLRNNRNLVTPAGLTNNGLVALAASKLNVTGTYTQGATGTYQPTVSGTGTAPLQFGQIDATAKATLGGKLEAAVGAGYTPVLRDKVDTVKAATGVNAPTWTATTQDPLRPRYDATVVKLIADIEPPLVAIGATTPRPLTNDATPAFAGTAGTKEGDAGTVQLSLFKSTAPATDLLPANSTATVTGGNWTFSSATPALESGATYTLRVRQSDDVKNVGEVTRTFVVDRVAPDPSISATSPKPRTNVQAPAIGGVGGGATGDDAEVTVALFSGSTPDAANAIIADTVVALGAGNAFSFTDASKTLAEGTYTWRVKQADAATNVGTVTKTFVVDRTLPTPGIDADKPALRTKTKTPAFAGPAGTATGDNGTVELDLFSGDAATGTDRLPTATATVSAGRWTFTAATPVLADGQYTLRIRQGDEAGNEGAVLKTFVVDNAGPALTLNASAPPASPLRTKTKTPMFSGTGGRAVGDVRAVELQVFTGTTTAGTPKLPAGTTAAVSATTGAWTYSPSPALADGTYTLRARQVDDLSNATQIVRTFVVDNEGPALAFNDPTPAAPTNVNTVQASGTGGRAAGDLAPVTVALFSGGAPVAANQVWTGTATVNATTGAWSVADAAKTLPDGVYTYRASQSDSAGNATTALKTITVDTVKPTIGSVAVKAGTAAGAPAIAEGATTTSKTVRFEFAAGETSTYRCKLELDGAAGTLEACTSPHDVTGLADGAYKFTVVATDRAGNVQATPTERTFNVVRGVNVAAGVLSYDAGAADDNVTVRSESVGGVPSFVIKNTEVAGVPAGEGCSQLTAIEAACPAAGVTKIHVGTGAGADKVNAPVAMALELDGGPGNDRLSGGSAADTLIGGDDDDLLDGRLGGDTMTGNGGTDTVTYAQRTTPVTLSFDGVRNDGAGCPGASCENDALGTAGTSDVEVVFGGQGADTISGAAGVDKLNGGPGNDALDAKGGNDTLSGNGGDDTLIGGPGPGTPDNDVVNGGDGTDLADYSARTTAVNVTLDDVANDGRPVSTVPAEKDDVRTDVENVTGSTVADTITGSARENVLKGGAGNDLLDGGFGSDVLDGGIGVDGASYALRTAGVTVDLSGSDAAREADAGNADDEAGDGRRDLLLAMEGARGGSARDLLTAGTLAGGSWFGNGGADRLEVRNAKADTVNCGTEADVVVADAGTLDTIDASCEPAGVQKP